MSQDRQPVTGRRRFIREVSLALLALPSFTRAAESARGGHPALLIRSGPGRVPHTHDLLIPYTLLRAPPRQGAILRSTRARFHSHDVALTQAQLSLVSHGGTVAATGGSHIFLIRKTRTPRGRSAALGGPGRGV